MVHGMPGMPVRYRSDDEDSARWLGFAHRPGDIVISTRSKHGTTWMQMICALLIFQTAELPAPLTRLSPWMDWLVNPLDQVLAELAAQRHRRFIKTHTPLDGLPLDPQVTYVVMARHPLDAAVSLYHQGDNLDRERLSRLTGGAWPDPQAKPRPPLADWLNAWIERDAEPRAELDSLPGVLRHLADAWARRGAGNVVLVHYDDLADDREQTMRELATRLGITVPEHRWPALVASAGFAAMRDRAEDLAPDSCGIFRDRSAFFRRGRSGGAREVLTPTQLARYTTRAAQAAPPELLARLHR